MELIVHADRDVVAELYPWLLEDLRGAPDPVSVNPRSHAEPGGMGAAEVLGLVIPNAIALGQLVMSVVAFRAARERGTGTAPPISIGRVDTLIMIDGDADEAVKRLLEALPELPRPVE